MGLLTHSFPLIARLCNHAVGINSETHQTLSALGDQLIAVTISDLQLVCFVQLRSGDITLLSQSEQVPALSISGSSWALLSLLRQGSTSRNEGVTLQGDVELAQTLQHIFNSGVLDLEEILSQVFGDIAAHELTKRGAQLKQTFKKMRRSVRDNVSDYLLEEARLFVGAEELEDFYNDVAILRNDVERSAVRLTKLEARGKENIT